MSIYPYIKYPYRVKKIIDGEFTYPSLGYLPTKPEEQDKIDKYGVKVIILSVLLLFIGPALDVMQLGIVAIFLFYLGLIIAWVESRTLKRNKRNFEIQLAEYYRQLEIYNRTINDHNQFSRNLKDYNWRTQHKKTLLENSLKFTTKPKIKAKSNTKGVTEKFFLGKLKLLFDENQIKVNRTIDQLTENFFIPDIIVFDKNHNVYIDVEIDEPYAFKTGEPIHYVETIDSFDQHKNDYRDNFFTENYWTVIRFAEEQIVSDPIKCCNLIGKIFYEMTFQDKYRSMYEDYENNPLNNVNFWNFEDAVAMYELKYREDYLKTVASLNFHWSQNYYDNEYLKKEKTISNEYKNIDFLENETGDLPF